jgi:hypothetical protein
MLIFSTVHLRSKRRAPPARRSRPGRANDTANQIESFRPCGSRRLTSATATRSFLQDRTALEAACAKMPVNTMGAGRGKP